jgi:hypothetical protein
MWPPALPSNPVKASKASKASIKPRVSSNGGTVSFGVASITFIVGTVSGSSLTTGMGLEGGLEVWGLAVVRPRRFSDKRPGSAASSFSGGAWGDGWGAAVQ